MTIGRREKNFIKKKEGRRKRDKLKKCGFSWRHRPARADGRRLAHFSFGNGKKVDMTDKVSVLSLNRLAS